MIVALENALGVSVTGEPNSVGQEGSQPASQFVEKQTTMRTLAELKDQEIARFRAKLSAIVMTLKSHSASLDTISELLFPEDVDELKEEYPELIEVYELDYLADSAVASLADFIDELEKNLGNS